MQVSLHHAGQIKSDLQVLVIDLSEFRTACSIYETNIPTIVGDRRAQLLDTKALADHAELTLFVLQKDIGHQNARVGISDLQIDQQRLESRRDRLKDLIETTPVHLDHIRGKLGTARDKAVQDHCYGGKSPEDVIRIDVLTPTDLADFRSQMTNVKRQLREINESLSTLRYRTTIDIADSTIEFLQGQGIL